VVFWGGGKIWFQIAVPSNKQGKNARNLKNLRKWGEGALVRHGEKKPTRMHEMSVQMGWGNPGGTMPKKENRKGRWVKKKKSAHSDRRIKKPVKVRVRDFDWMKSTGKGGGGVLHGTQKNANHGR